MPFTLKTADNAARKWERSRKTTAEELFQDSCSPDRPSYKRMIQSSFSHSLSDSHVSSTANGFVYAILNAYSYHHHLTLPLEDVWFSILNQFSFYVRSHAEEVRSMFVSHEGKKDVVDDDGIMDRVDFGELAVRLTEEVEKNLVDPELSNWTMPDFSTTTENDTVVAAILMLGTMQEYFSYTMRLGCGIPSVTLLGERSDWNALLKKIDKLSTFGKEPTQFAQLLRPILARFVA